MSIKMNTPGVYITENPGPSNAITAVETAIPAFIGYTQKADFYGKPGLNTPVQINSFSDFVTLYGTAPAYSFALTETTDTDGFTGGGKLYETVANEQSRYCLYNAIRLFYANGGQSCCIVSIGDYNTPKQAADFTRAIDLLKNGAQVTLLVIPEIMLLNEQDCAKVQQYMIAHCGALGNRMALLDVYNGYEPPGNDDKSVIERFRKNLPANNLDFAAAYYPWLDTSICDTDEVSFANISNTDLLKQVLLADAATQITGAQYEQFQQLVNALPTADPVKADRQLRQSSAFYNTLLNDMLKKINRLPPSAAIAGIYTLVDHNRGVWKAPANVQLSKVNAPAVLIDYETQADLNVPLSGKAINAIRSFVGNGILIWGARTCDGNSPDWRYINVRRTVIMIEQSIKLMLNGFVFAPNDAQTWQTITSMAQNFLNSLWTQGALIGTSASDAYTVQIGLGSTMTGEDVQNGTLRLVITVSLVRPAEFMVLEFVQQMAQP